MAASNAKSVVLGNNYTLQAYFAQGDRYTSSNYSKVYVEAKLTATNTNWSSSYASYLRVYWHDNRENYDRLVAEVAMYGCNQWTDYYASGTIDVYHNNDGNLSGYAYATFTKGGTSSYAPSSGGVATDWTALWKIDRYPILNNGSNFNDESNPVYNITSYNTFPIRIKIEAGGNSQLIIRDVPKNTSGDYTLELTEQERNTLRALCPNSNTLAVRETVCAMNGSTELSASYKDYTMTIVNGNPEFDDFDYEETETAALTGSTGKFISGYSDVKITVTNGNKAEAIKSATIANYQTFIGSSSKKFDNTIQYPLNYTVENVDSPIIITYAIDSRGNSTPVTRQAELINYTPISYSNFELVRTSNISEETTMRFTGKIDLVNFGLVTNAIKYIIYYYKKVGQPDSAYVLGGTTLTPTVDANGNISINQTIEGDEVGEGFNQNYAYVVKLEIIDELLNVYSDSFTCTETLGSGSPAKAVYDNCIALGMPYDESQGGRVQLSEDTYVKQGNNYKRIPIPVELWSRSKGSFNAQTVDLDLSDYDIVIIEFNTYTGHDVYVSKTVITKDVYYCITDDFFYNNTYYRGLRNFKVKDTGVEFGAGQNESKNTDNSWYNPTKIIGLKTS